MSRVSDTSSSSALRFAMNRVKEKLEDLHIKGASLKKIVKPSDDPIGNVELLALRSQKADNTQFIRNNNYAQVNLEYTDAALSDITEILNKVKEIAIAQSSDVYNKEVRKNVAKEVNQLKKQMLAVANRRLGNRYLFSGYKTQSQPFDKNGKYHGDGGQVHIEISKDFFVPINLTGYQIFFNQQKTKVIDSTPSINKIYEDEFKDDNKSTDQLDELDQSDLKLSNSLADNQENEDKIKDKIDNIRKLASIEEKSFENQDTVFDILDSLETALENNIPDIVQDLLEKIDSATTKIVTLRTLVGSVSNSAFNSANQTERNQLNIETYKSNIEDADIAELFTDIKKQQDILEATYATSANMMRQKLLDFIR